MGDDLRPWEQADTRACRVSICERLWTTAARASSAVRRDGREQFTAVVLLVCCDLIGLTAVVGIEGMSRAHLLVRFDAYAADGVWVAIMVDADVTGDEVQHQLALHAHQMARARLGPQLRRPAAVVSMREQQ